MDFRDEILEQLILDGLVEFAGLDKNGEMLYSFAEDIETKAPEIFNIMMDYRMRDIRDLWALGFLKMDITSPNPTVTITEKAIDDEAIGTLSDDLQIALEEIKSMMRKRDD